MINMILDLKIMHRFRLISIVSLIVMTILSSGQLYAAPSSFSDASDGKKTPELACVKAPPLGKCSALKTDLGVWDDCFVFDDASLIVLRSGTDLYSVSLTGKHDIKKVLTLPEMDSIQFEWGATRGGKSWLFCRAKNSAAFAIDVTTGHEVQLTGSGKDLDECRDAQTFSCLTAPHLEATIVEVTGTGKPDWPRDGNRPVYFWFNLQSGKTIQLPIGWDLEYFSADQSVAVFEKPSEEICHGRPLAALDMKTGECTEEIPDRSKVYWTRRPINEYDRYVNRKLVPQMTRSLRLPFCPSKGYNETFAGLSVDGEIYPFTIPLQEKYCLASADSYCGWTLLSFTPEGGSPFKPRSHWLRPLKPDGTATEIASDIVDAMLVGPGSVPNCLPRIRKKRGLLGSLLLQ